MKARKYATEIVETLRNGGYTAYFAGGWVRDYILGHPSADIDIATSARVDEIRKLFPKTIPVGEAFGVVIVLKENIPFEVATFRRDIEYVDGRKPSKIELSSSPLEDAKRRDFTINGMFYDPLKDEIIDFVEGRQDLNRGLIRAIGNPNERFVEDRLRMIRAIRIAARFGFKIDPETAKAIEKNAHTLFPAVAIERIWNELKKMGEGKHFDKAIVDLHRFGLLQEIFPGIKLQPGTKFPHGTPAIFSIMELFRDETPIKRQEIGAYLKVSNKDMELIALLDHVKGLKNDDLVSWAHFYADPRSEIILKVYPHHLPHKLKPHIQRIAHKTPLVGSKELMNEGISPGIQMGMLIKEAERIAITEDIHTSGEVIALLKQTPLWKK